MVSVSSRGLSSRLALMRGCRNSTPMHLPSDRLMGTSNANLFSYVMIGPEGNVIDRGSAGSYYPNGSQREYVVARKINGNAGKGSLRSSILKCLRTSNNFCGRWNSGSCFPAGQRSVWSTNKRNEFRLRNRNVVRPAPTSRLTEVTVGRARQLPAEFLSRRVLESSRHGYN